MQPNINSMKPYYDGSSQKNFSGPVSNGAVMQNNPLLKQAEKVNEGNSNILVGGVIGGTTALLWISDFINKSLRKDYDSTIFGSIERWGNNITTKPPVSKVTGAFSSFVDKIKNNSLVKNSQIINTMVNKPGKAGPLGQPQAHSVRGYLMSNALDALKNYSSMEASELLKNYASNPAKYRAALNDVRTRLLNSPAQTQLIERFIANPAANLSSMLTEFIRPENQKLIQDFAADPSKYKDAMEAFKYAQSKNPAALKALEKFIANPTDPNLLKNILQSSDSLIVDKELSKLIKLAEKDTYKYKDQIIKKIEELVTKNPALKDKILKSSASSMFMPKWLIPKFMREKVTFNEILNKNRLINNYKSLKSPLGAKLSGGFFRSLEASTNGMVGGKMGVLMQALFIGQSLKSAVNAPEGEKLSTFMEELLSMMAYTMTMGMQMRVLNSAAGLKFLGMDQKDYEKYHRAVELAKKAAKVGDSKAYNRLTGLIKVYETRADKNLKLWQKPVKWFGKLLSVGRVKETVRPLKIKGNGIVGKPLSVLYNTFRAMPHKLKVAGGFIGRTALIMAVISPIFSNWAVKLSHKIFGKPSKSILENSDNKAQPVDTQNTEAPKPGNLLDQLNNKYKTNTQPTTTQTPSPVTSVTPKNGNLLDMLNKTHTASQVSGSQPLSSQTIASQSINTTPAISQGDTKRTYIPSPILGEEPAFVQSSQSRYGEIEAALLKADKAEMAAQAFLNNI